VTAGILVTLWTVRIAMAHYAIAAAAWLLRRSELARGAWTAGLVFFLAHVAAAFQFVHHWSHDAARIETARQAREMAGVDSGFGLWMNYAFAALWLGDVAWMWASPESHAKRARLAGYLLHAFLLFVAINGAIVFAHGGMRSTSIAGLAGLLLLALYRYGQARRATR
jgi:hypothetical protein